MSGAKELRRLEGLRVLADEDTLEILERLRGTLIVGMLGGEAMAGTVFVRIRWCSRAFELSRKYGVERRQGSRI